MARGCGTPRCPGPGPAGQTDDLVYDTTRAQLAELCRGERHVRLYLYQTGLETAVVGFYKALADHLLRYPGIGVGPADVLREAWRRAPGRRRPRPAAREPVTEQSALFRKGTPWTM